MEYICTLMQRQKPRQGARQNMHFVFLKDIAPHTLFTMTWKITVLLFQAASSLNLPIFSAVQLKQQATKQEFMQTYSGGIHI